MSKFIRTKEGIYKVDAYDNAGTCIVGGFDNRKTFYKDEYLKMTDTIEELCDEFVIHNFSYYKKPYIPTSQINIKAIPIETFIKCDMQLYGAIWTDKGLIYVAKMNEKGDLELI